MSYKLHGPWPGDSAVLPSGPRGRVPCPVSPAARGQLLHKVELLQVQLQDRVFHGSEHEADVLRVGGTREVGVDDLLLVGILVLIELQDKVSGRFDILLRPWSQ